MQYDYDVIVLGAGPAGESAALNATKLNLKTAVIDNQSFVGGACTHKGTIPSKSLRRSVRDLMHFNNHPLLQRAVMNLDISYPELLKDANRVIDKQVQMRTGFYTRNRIALIQGEGSFADPHTLNIRHKNGDITNLSAKYFIIATGSRPYQPADIDFTHPRICDSDSILKMDYTPRKMIIYGAGVIGCEYASIFAGLNIRVDLLNTRDRLLEFLDDEITDALGYQLSKYGCILRHNESYKKVTADDHGVTVELESGKRLHADTFLWSNGRSGNTHTLNLEAAGLETNSRGQLSVNKEYQTNVEHIYAAGDVIGWPSLASAAYNQGMSATGYASGKEKHLFVKSVPTGIYTLPEISSVGKTERELTEEKIPFEIGRAFFKDTAKAQISGDKVGMLKILFHSETLQVLGVHCFGAEASEIIHIGQAIMKQKGEANTIEYFSETTFNYPTMAEAYRIAALNGLNRIKGNAVY